MLIISTEPSGAKIYLDGRAQTEMGLKIFSPDEATTPAKIKNIVPGDYTLHLEKDGYWPYQKRITINPGESVVAQDINLFLNDQPALLASSSGATILLSPDHQYLYSPLDGLIINLRTGRSRSLSPDPDGFWTSDNRLLSKGNLYDPKDYSRDRLFGPLIGQKADAWQYDKDGRLFYRLGNTLGYLSQDKRTAKQIIKGEVLAYEARGQHVYVVIKDNGQTFLRDYLIDSGEIKGQTSLPNAGHYVFRDDGGTRLSLYDQKNQTLYLFDPGNITSGGNAINQVSAWTSDGTDNLFFHNGWEIYRYDFNRNTSSLLTRLGEKLDNLALNQTSNYLAISSETSLMIFDLRTGLITQVYQTEKIGALALDPSSHSLYFQAASEKHGGIYELKLQ